MSGGKLYPRYLGGGLVIGVLCTRSLNLTMPMRVPNTTDMTNQKQESPQGAREFAVSAHGDQKYGDQPYAVHLDDVSRTLAELGFSDDELQMIAMLHDVLEDTHASASEIAERFGVGVLEAVKQLTCGDVGALVYFSSMGESAMTVKLADRPSNVRALGQAGSASEDKHRGLLQKYKSDMLFVATRASAIARRSASGDQLRNAVKLLEEALSAAAVRLGVDEPDRADLPEYFIVGDRPVKSVPTDEGGLDVQAYDWTTGAFIRAMEYLTRISFQEGEVERDLTP